MLQPFTNSQTTMSTPTHAALHTTTHAATPLLLLHDHACLLLINRRRVQRRTYTQRHLRRSHLAVDLAVRRCHRRAPW
uniref:Uncharacterized protein n=1 Tax=Arundo donax TaxID=35708 RepID=A0A0A9HA41_ARUDO